MQGAIDSRAGGTGASQGLPGDAHLADGAKRRKNNIAHVARLDCNRRRANYLQQDFTRPSFMSCIVEDFSPSFGMGVRSCWVAHDAPAGGAQAPIPWMGLFHFLGTN